MSNYLLSICYRLGIPPNIWMIHNPIKIYEYLEVTRKARLKLNDTVVDLGCGPGIWTSDLARRSRKVIGIDISKDAISKALRYTRNSPLNKRLQFYTGELTDLDVLDNSIDHIFSFCVLEHIEDLSSGLSEIKKILRPGGHLHVSVDSLATIKDEALKAKHQNEHSVIQYFTVASLRNKLLNAGLQVNSIYPILKGKFALQEFKKRILGQSYNYGLFARKAMVNRLKEEDRHQDSEEGIMIVAHAACL